MGNQFSENGCLLSHVNRSPDCNGHTNCWLHTVPPACMTMCNPSLLPYLLQWADVAGCVLHQFAVVTCMGWAHDLPSAENGSSLPWSEWKPHDENTQPWQPTLGHWGTEQQRPWHVAQQKPLYRVLGIMKCNPTETVTCRQQKAITCTTSTSYAVRLIARGVLMDWL